MGTTLQRIISSFSLLCLFFLATFPLIPTTATVAMASPEYDRVYQLDSVAWLKSSDNVDDMFADFIDQHYEQFFKKEGRFQIKKITGLNAILTGGEVPYTTLIDDSDILKRISQKFKVENLIRTKVYKEAQTYRFVIEWVFAPKNTVLSKHEFRFVDPGKEDGLKDSELPQALDQALAQLISQLPFLGKVSGVEGEIITVDLGRTQNVKPKQIFEIETLDGVKIHPKLKTIEQWKWVSVGKAQVEQVEDSMSFARIIEVEPNKRIIRLQKIRTILPAPPEPKKPEAEDVESDLPRLGWVASNLSLGFYSRDVGTSSGGRGGSGISLPLDVEGLLWLNSRFVSQASFSAALIGISPTDLSTNTETGTSYNGSATQVRLALGYSLIPAKTIFDSIAWIHFGYRTTNYSLPTSSGDLTGGSSMGSLFVGVGGEVPFRDVTTLQFGMDLGLIKSPENTAPDFGDITSSTDLMFYFAATYKLNEQFHARGVIKINSQSMDFSGGQSVSQKLLSIGPSILYYF